MCCNGRMGSDEGYRTLGAIVLAGGHGRRMGQDKSQLVWQGETFLGRICRSLVLVADPIVVVGRQGHLPPTPPGVAVIEDRQSGIGPLMGLASGLAYLMERRVEWGFVTTCDVPLIQPELANRLLVLAQNSEAAIPIIEGHVFGLTAVYRTNLAPRLFELIDAGLRRVRDLPQQLKCHMADMAELADIDPQAASFRNINTPEEYAQLTSFPSAVDTWNRNIDLFAADAAIGTLRQVVREFVDERSWGQFHSPKNLTMSLAVEAAELMEHFQWLTTDESRQVREDHTKRDEVIEEMADVFCYLLALANELDADLAVALVRKMEKNRQKYPVDQFRGRFGYDDHRAIH